MFAGGARRRMNAYQAVWLLVGAIACPQVAYAQFAPTTEDEPDRVEEEPAPTLTKPPELLEFVQPGYPPELFAQGITGEVVLNIDIGVDGTVSDVSVVSSTDPAFEAPAMAAARQFRFSPAEVDFEPSAIRIEYGLRFEAIEPEPDAVAGRPSESAPPLLPVTFEGQVLEAGERAPVSGAEILIGGQTLTRTDSEGRFQLRGVPSGSFLVSVRSPYFAAYEVQEERSDTEKLSATYYLRRTSRDPFETVVRSRTPKREVARVELSREEISKVPGTFGDPIRVIENLPGLARVPGGLGGALIVRGANPADTGIYIDGVEIPILYHFLGLTSVLPPDFLENIQFYPGGFSAKYSRATAGIVDVTTRDLDCERLRINVEIDFVDSAAYTCVPVGSWSVAAAIRRSYFDLFIPLILDAAIDDDDEGRVTASPVYSDYQIKAETVAGDHRITFFSFGSSDDLEFIRSGSTEEVNVDGSFDQYFNRIVGRDRWTINDDVQLISSLAFGYSRQSFRFVSDDIDLDNEIDIPIYSLDWREELRLKLSDELDLRVGLDHTFGYAPVVARTPVPANFREFPTATFDFTEAQETRQTPRDATQGYWAEVEWKPLPGLTLIPGVRIDDFDFESAQDFRVLPRLAARWEVTEGTTLKGAYGQFARLPDPQFLAEPPIGQPELETERSQQYIGGIEQNVGSSFFLDLQGYYIDRDNLRQPNNEVDFIDGQAIPRVFDNGGEGYTYGMDLLFRKERSADSFWYGWIAYTLSRTIRRDTFGLQGLVNDTDTDTEGITNQDADVEEYKSPFDQPHILTIIGQFDLPWGLEFGARFRLVSGNPFTPLDVNEPFQDSDFNAYVSSTDGVELNSDRIPIFHQLDIRIDRTWVYDLWKLTAYLEVLNVYNRSNVEGINYDFRFRERTEVTFLPIVPVLGVKGEF